MAGEDKVNKGESDEEGNDEEEYDEDFNDDDDGEDDEDEDEIDDEEVDNAPKKKKSSGKAKKRKSKRKHSKDDDEEEEEEEEHLKRARKFLDVEAEVEEDGEDDEEEGDDEFVELGEAEAAEEEATAKSRAKYARADRIAFGDDDADIAAMAAKFDSKYKDYKYDEEEYDEEPVEEEEVIDKRALLPDVHDPKLWLCKTNGGVERQALLQLMQRVVANPQLQILSVTASDHLKRHIYIEAMSEAHVKKAIDGIRSLQAFSLKLVPITEMPDIFKVSSKKAEVEPGSWVRIKRGLYQGDIAQVVDVDTSVSKATVKLIPRLDLRKEKEREKEKDSDDPNKKQRKRSNKLRPPPKFFDPAEVRQRLGSVEIERRRDLTLNKLVYTFRKEKFIDGFLHKTIPFRAFDFDSVIPTIDEQQRFQSAVRTNKENESDDDEERDIDEKVEPTSIQPPLPSVMPLVKGVFSRGDRVRVISGPLLNLKGIVEIVQGDQIIVAPSQEIGMQLMQMKLNFDASELEKCFQDGDHVKVLTGKYEGETGLIVHVDDVEKTIAIFSDLTNEQIVVRPQDIQICADIATGKMKLGIYELHDLVQLNATRVGVIVRIEKDTFKVLDQTGNVLTMKLQEMGRKRRSRDAETFDRHNNTIRCNDSVKVLDGQYKGRKGTVLHISRYFVFIHSRDVMENAGVFVVRSQHLQLVGGRGANQAANSPFVLQSPGHYALGTPGRVNAPPISAGRGRYSHAAPSPDNPAANKTRGRDPLLQQTVKILKGAFKGYIGDVIETNDATIRVELHSNQKKVTVDRVSVKPFNRSGEVQELMDYQYGDGGRTPMRGDQTPIHYSTPSRTPRTPTHDAWNLYSNTPSRSTPNPYGTPNPYSTPNPYGTPAWDGGTPAYAPNTPQHPASPFVPTPAAATEYQSTAPTTPGSYHVDTPSMYSHSYPSGAGRTIPTPAEPTYYDGTVTTPQTPGLPATPAIGILEGEKRMGGELFGEDTGISGSSFSRHEESYDWISEGIEAIVIKGINTGTSAVIVSRDSRTEDGVPLVNLKGIDRSNRAAFTTAANNIELVTPRKNDRVKIIRGQNVGKVGSVGGIEAIKGEVYVKLDGGGIIMEAQKNLAKLALT